MTIYIINSDLFNFSFYKRNKNYNETIKNNWKLNEIPNVILSSATLPHYDELKDTIIDFKTKFENARKGFEIWALPHKTFSQKLNTV